MCRPGGRSLLALLLLTFRFCALFCRGGAPRLVRRWCSQLPELYRIPELYHHLQSVLLGRPRPHVKLRGVLVRLGLAERHLAAGLLRRAEPQLQPVQSAVAARDRLHGRSSRLLVYLLQFSARHGVSGLSWAWAWLRTAARGRSAPTLPVPRGPLLCASPRTRR